MIFFHGGDLDTTGWLIVGRWLLVILAIVVGVIGGIFYAIYRLAKWNGNRLIQKRRLEPAVGEHEKSNAESD